MVGNSKGLAARYKYLAQSVVGARASPSALHRLHQSLAETSLYVPFFKTVAVPMSTAGFVALAYFVIVGTSNAVNLTDGLDGLAIMPAVMVAAALGVFAYATGNVKFAHLSADSLHPRRGRGARSSARRWWARASDFSGSTPIRRRCSWAMWARWRIGAALGTMAVIVRQEIVLFVMGGVFVLETVSVMLQVASFKLTGKRIFRMAPHSSSFRTQGVGRAESDRAFLDHQLRAGVGGPCNLEDPLMHSVVVGLGKTGASCLRYLAKRGDPA